ncbi:unnamed protein product [Pneumocystis jirovecii]|uniref:Mitochondrial distribution and morphology protein 34 n=2 Tax=Pneumocystis jirovecii TaxID=42068 RepID=L0PGN3_PNEJI|nr:uncharacterized protein T551_01330 [Pneumocystis jirovecii RU7]KTW31258.1 hypothetical protein T551_01330 [Pneumocystis jirovecii RU7]CCJ31372.1 unnamed protein product [Pneumocystis jirovecii]
MAFHFSWNKEFSQSFIEKTSSLLSYALNKGNKLPIIVDKIDVKELNMGSKPPELEILEIGDLAEDRFRGLFKLRYTGDAYIVLQTKVQINPLNTHKNTSPKFTWKGILFADAPLIVPMFLRLSDFKLSGIVVLVFSKAKGVTLVFRNDPVESVRVSSTFDSIPVIAQFLQKEIEKQLRTFFQEELPAIIHKLSISMPPKSIEKLNTNSSTTILTNESKNKEPTPLIRLADINPEHPISITGMLRFAALASSQKTLCPFTPSISQAIYRSSHLLSTVSAVNCVFKNSLSNSPSLEPTTSLTTSYSSTCAIEMQNFRQNLSLRQNTFLNKRWTLKKHNVICLRSDSKDSAFSGRHIQPLVEKNDNISNHLRIESINTFHNTKKEKTKQMHHHVTNIRCQAAYH